MTREELANALPEPFNFFALHGSIDYRCEDGRDHAYVKKLGYETHSNPDSSSSCSDIPWFQFSSYGWGTMFGDTDDNGRQIFYDMWKAGIITLWRGRTYPGDYSVIDYENGVFKKYDPYEHKWGEIPNPFKAKKTC